VSDAGPGFPADDADRLFELFYRSNRTASKPGAGIGLFVARQLARSMGGELSARPGPHGGAEFVLSLRAFSTPDELMPDARAPRAAVAASSDTAVR
jgi:signal transduction histidine kinase